MTRIDSLARHFWDGFRCMSVCRPLQSQVRYYHAWRRAVAIKNAPANPAWQRYVAQDEILREAAKTLSYIPSFKPESSHRISVRKRA